MLEEEGIVVSVEGKFAFVAAQPSSACEGCSQKGVCHVLGGGEKMVIKALNDSGATVGSRVRVAIASRTFFKASALIYLLPVAALVAGGLFGKAIVTFSGLKIDAEVFSAIIGLISLVVSFVAVKFLAKKIGEKNADLARVTRVLDV